MFHPLRTVALLTLIATPMIALAQQTQVQTRTIYETVEEEVPYFNPYTGRYETRTITKQVPVNVMEEVPASPAVRQFSVTFFNHHDYPIKLSLSRDSATVQPKRSISATVSEGERYSYAGPPTRGSGGRMLGGVGMHGIVSSVQREIHLGRSSQALKPLPNPVDRNLRGDYTPTGPVSRSFTVTFVNKYQAPVSLTIYNADNIFLGTKTLEAGASVDVQAKLGYTYVKSGPTFFSSNGTAKSSTARGELTPIHPTIFLGY